jgi:hypothetical protein
MMRERNFAATVCTMALALVMGVAVTAGAQSAPPPGGQKPAEAAKPDGARKPQAGEEAKPGRAEAAKPALPPDTKALRDASDITDPDKQIEALRKVIETYPTSAAAGSAESMIVGALTRKTTSDITGLKEAAGKYADGGATPNEQARRLVSIAGSFAGAGVLLDDAEQYAKKALDVLPDEKTWIAAEKQAAAASRAEALKNDPKAKPRPEMSDAEQSTRYTSARQNAMTTLAQIYEKKSRAADAELAYREAYNLAPKSGGTAALKLADYAKAAGHPFEQLEYLTVATLAGRVTAASRADLEALYKQTRGGSAADLDRMLDERYETEAVKVDATPYKASKARTSRVVLAELFTGAGCPPCVGADLAFEAALERYSSRDLAVLVYHQHIPKPDPMTNPSTAKRKEYYDVPGTPTYFFDGGDRHAGGGAASGAGALFRDTVESVVDTRLDVKPGATIRIEAAVSGGRIELAARVRTGGKPGRKLRLQVALVERMVRYSGENGVRFHPMVVRSLAGVDKDALGFPLVSGRSAKIAWTFDVAQVAAAAGAHLDEMEGGASERFGKFRFIQRKSDIDRDNLRVVAWVQDEATKEVLQAAAFDVTPAASR